jgi:hypothetical protein
MSPYLELFRGKAASRETVVGVVGLGYVGLPLAVEAARSGFQVVGFDIVDSVVDGINSGSSHIGDVSSTGGGRRSLHGVARSHHGHGAPGGVRRHQHLRAYTPLEDQGP